MHAFRGTQQGRVPLRLAATVAPIASMLAILVGGAAPASSAPRGRSTLELGHNDPLIARQVERIRTWSTQALHDEELLLELYLEWRQRQLEYSGGMLGAGGVLTAVGGLIWGLSMPAMFAGWAADRREYLACRGSRYDLCGSDAIDFSGLFLMIFGPPVAALIIVGVPLLVAGVVRRHLAKHPAAAPRLKTVGAGMGWSGLGVFAVGLVLTFFIPDTFDSVVPLSVLVGSNVCLIGLVLGLSGAAVWGEAQRGQELRKSFGFRDHLPWKPASDRQARVRQEATRRAGLPRAHIWTYAFRF